MNTLTHSMPQPARWLGFGGLVPFCSLAAASLLDPSHASRWAFALLAYGAVILSFVGALHWGFATVWQSESAGRRARMMYWSVVPALGAWVALLLPPQAGAGVLSVLFVVHYLFDVALARRGQLPSWYLRLRTPLTIGAVASLATAAITL